MDYKMPLSVCCIFLSVVSLSIISYAQLQNCFHTGSCSAYSVGGGYDFPCDCDLRMGYTTCNGYSTSFRKSCLHYPNIRDCECGCSQPTPTSNGFGGTISYHVVSTGRYVVESYDCFGCPQPTPTPTPNPTPTSNCLFPANYVLYPQTGCPSGRVNQGGCCTCSATDAFIQQCERFGGYDPDTCGCTGSRGTDGSCSPIVVDVSGNGFSLTNVQNGVLFDLAAAGNPRQCAWTAVDSDEAWLSLDRNQNGLIDSGKELFGNVTAQVPQDGKDRNGFLALAEYDKLMNGGNNDGVIGNQDFIFSRLRLWQDANHNGISEANELKTLPELGLENIELDYRESRKTDQFGNQFRFRAKVRDAHGAQFGRWAWDVFLVTEP